MFQNVETEEERVDDRSVEDLLSFINGGNGGRHECVCTLINWFIFALQRSIYADCSR